MSMFMNELLQKFQGLIYFIVSLRLMFNFSVNRSVEYFPGKVLQIPSSILRWQVKELTSSPTVTVAETVW